MMTPEATQLLTSQLRPCWKSQSQWNQNPVRSFFGKVPCLGHFFMAFPVPSAVPSFIYKLPGSGCLPHPAQWDCSFSPVLVGESVSKACVSLGDDEPFGTSQGSSSKQRFQRSTRVKKEHVLPKGPMACGLCSSLTQQTPSTFGKDMHSQDHFIFPSLCWQSCHCCTVLMTAQIGRDHGFNRKFSLCLELLQGTRDKARVSLALASPAGVKALEERRGESELWQEISIFEIHRPQSHFNLSCNSLLYWGFSISAQGALFAILLHYNLHQARTDIILYKLRDHFWQSSEDWELLDIFTQITPKLC